VLSEISRRRPALLSLTIGKGCFKNPAGFLKAGRRRLICISSRKFSERLLRLSKRLSGKAEEQKAIETGGEKYQSPSETVFDIWRSRFLPEVSLSGFLRGNGFRRPLSACLGALQDSAILRRKHQPDTLTDLPQSRTKVLFSPTYTKSQLSLLANQLALF